MYYSGSRWVAGPEIGSTSVGLQQNDGNDDSCPSSTGSWQYAASGIWKDFGNEDDFVATCLTGNLLPWPRLVHLSNLPFLPHDLFSLLFPLSLSFFLFMLASFTSSASSFSSPNIFLLFLPPFLPLLPLSSQAALAKLTSSPGTCPRKIPEKGLISCPKNWSTTTGPCSKTKTTSTCIGSWVIKWVVGVLDQTLVCHLLRLIPTTIAPLWTETVTKYTSVMRGRLSAILRWNVVPSSFVLRGLASLFHARHVL